MSESVGVGGIKSVGGGGMAAALCRRAPLRHRHLAFSSSFLFCVLAADARQGNSPPIPSPIIGVGVLRGQTPRAKPTLIPPPRECANPSAVVASNRSAVVAWHAAFCRRLHPYDTNTLPFPPPSFFVSPQWMRARAWRATNSPSFPSPMIGVLRDQTLRAKPTLILHPLIPSPGRGLAGVGGWGCVAKERAREAGPAPRCEMRRPGHMPTGARAQRPTACLTPTPPPTPTPTPTPTPPPTPTSTSTRLTRLEEAHARASRKRMHARPAPRDETNMDGWRTARNWPSGPASNARRLDCGLGRIER
ncbi:hypothetical protein B0H17DRAFT_1139228 [Mycena rosella]|uniref:Uncharacterized protein n=1 Tax=Mycena rosella TaxID=1033263 RepID=A0AAD7D601_MYCRO|nr:hypothetical protein B0H17DRAFT_1139228 [Mycena rosella]